MASVNHKLEKKICDRKAVMSTVAQSKSRVIGE